MADTRTPEQRRRIMQSVGTKNTGPEMIVRRCVHALGLRYRLHRKDLPGTPDLVFPSPRKIIFVHGCFWHGHGCPKGQLPKSGDDYWRPKIERNRERDADAVRELEAAGWEVFTVWQCMTSSPADLEATLRNFLLINPENSIDLADRTG